MSTIDITQRMTAAVRDTMGGLQLQNLELRITVEMQAAEIARLKADLAEATAPPAGYKNGAGEPETAPKH